jgi:hypothetical protein
MNRLTQKSRGAPHDAPTAAARPGRTEVDGERLLLTTAGRAAP